MKRSTSGMAVYPWHRWLRRRSLLRLVRGEDYACQPHSMAQQVRNAAVREGVGVSVHIDGDVVAVLVRR